MNMNISIILPFFRPQIYNFLMIYPNKCGNFVDNMFFLTAEKLIIQLTDEYWRVGASARRRGSASFGFVNYGVCAHTSILNYYIL